MRKISLNKQRSPIHQHRYSQFALTKTRLTTELTVRSIGKHNDGAVNPHVRSLIRYV